MAPLPVNVQALRGDVVVDRIERPVRRLPSGALGVEYLGLVYPLTSEGHIDLVGEWHYPGQAPICLDPPLTADASAHEGWWLDLDGRRPYLFVRGAHAMLLEVVRRLECAGFEPEHWGPSFRERAAGPAYDWFVRLPFAEARDPPSEWDVQQVLRGLSFDETELAAPQTVSELADETAGLRQQIIDLEAQLADQVRRWDLVQATATESQRAYRSEIARARDAAAFLQAAVRQLKAKTGAQPATADASAVASDDALLGALEASKQELQDAISHWVASEEERQAATEAAAALRARVVELEAAQFEKPTPGQRGGVARARMLVRDVQTTLAVFAPTIALVRASAEFIATEVADRSDLFTKLRSLEFDRTSLKAKRVQGADGWLELHFSTGLARDGQLYFKKLEGDAAGWDVLVSDKAAQPKDVDWMAQQ